MIEIGVVNEPSAGFTAPNAKRLEDMGFDYLLTPDTQNLSADPYGQLSLAAAATKTIKLGTGVTNPITRDVAVTASALAVTATSRVIGLVTPVPNLIVLVAAAASESCP